MIDVPVNQHTGPHWTEELQEPPRDSDNSITVKIAAIGVGHLAKDAYIMSAKVKNGKVVNRHEHGVYDIGVIRCIVSKNEYSGLGLKTLELPSV